MSEQLQRIQVLSHDVINQIAAGEVVERPAHLVKELLENSLDAGATKIQIDISFGGKFIKITDNGTGIYKDELRLALQRHATSKIKKTDDLWSLNTYGFRGEALASVAAVSKMTIMSKPVEQKKAHQIRSDFGQLSDIMESSLTEGTQIIVDSLFENIPARLKFLKSDSAETSQIRNVVKALALVYPQAEIKFIENGKLDLFFKPVAEGETLQRAKQILGLDQVYVGEYKNENYHVKVYYASPHETLKTSKNIWIFAQKRWIQDRALQAAVMDAYRSLLMHGEYPQVVVDLVCAPELVDVNIHPTKSQVKFRDSSEAFRAVHSALRRGLETSPWTPGVLTSGAPSAVAMQNTNHAANMYQSSANQTHQNQMTLHDTQKSSEFSVTQFKTKMDQFAQLRVDAAPAHSSLFSTAIGSTTSLEQEKGYWGSLQVLGQLNLTYLVCQKNDRMILVDQHAAHERVAFEKLMRKWKGGVIDQQDYLFPLAIDLSVEKVEALMGKESEIAKMGILVEMLGPSVLGVKSAPSFIKESALPKVFDKLAHDLIEYGGSYSLEKSIADLFATMACHSVVRAGQSLSLLEMQELLNSMDEFPLSSFCPHGRPVSVEYLFADIEKQFGRTL